MIKMYVRMKEDEFKQLIIDFKQACKKQTASNTVE